MAATHESLAMLAAVRALDLDGVVSDVEIEETRAALRDAREMLANPLAYPPREEKDRAVVRQGAVEVRGREVRLGALDIENALILSDAFDLNELVCVELLVAAVERGAPPEQCLKPAAGMFLRERQNRVESLERLLRETLKNTSFGEKNTSVDDELGKVVDGFTRDILTGSEGRTLIGRLVEILSSPPPGELSAGAAKASGAYVVQTPGGTAATPGGGVVPYQNGGFVPDVSGGLLSDAAIAAAAAAMTHVVDERGRACRKKDWLAHERKLLAECLFRAVALAKRTPSAGSGFATNNDFEKLARLFAETASPTLATAAADVNARAAAMESGAAVGPGAGSGPGALERGGSMSNPSAAGGGRFSVGDGSGGVAGRGGFEEAPSLSAAEARVGCVDELGDLAAGVADELPAALAILFATLEAVTPETGSPDAGASSTESAAVAAAAAAFGPVLASASAAAAAQFRRARDGDDADAAAEMAAANPLRSAALGGGFGGLMFGRSQDRSAADDAATEVSCARAGVLELSRFSRGLAVLFASSGTSGETAKKEIVAASDDGALVALRCVLATGAFRDENEFSRRAYLELTLKILRSAMRAALNDADLGEALAAVTPAMTADQIAREERHAASADATDARDGFGTQRGAPDAFDAYGNPAYGAGDDYYGRHEGGNNNDVHFSEGERLRAMREDEDSVREAPLVALCRALAEAYRQSPESARKDLAEDVASVTLSETLQRNEATPLRAFLDAICEWEHGVESLSAALEVLAALAASGEAGARDAWERLRAPSDGAAVAWDHFLGAVAGYNKRFAFGDVEDETTNSGDAKYRSGRDGRLGGQTENARELPSDREMPEADVRGMVAYLDVLTRCLGGGDDWAKASRRASTNVTPAEARDRVAWLSQRCGGAGGVGSFLDQLMRLHANPVPSRLKAALLKCAGAAAGDSAAGAAEAWGRMEAAAILQTRANLSLSSSSGAFAFDDAAGYDGAHMHTHGSAFHETRSGGSGGYGRGGYDFDDSGRGYVDAGGYGAAAAARQRFIHERRAFEGAQNAADKRDQLAVPGADLAYEFKNSEARARTYPHASSYVRLVNKLMRACEQSRVGPCADAGRASAAQFAFVRDGVFGELRRRRHKSQEERWWLACDALEHFRIQLRVWRDAVRSGDEAASLVASDYHRLGEEEDGSRSRRDAQRTGPDGWNAQAGLDRLGGSANAHERAHFASDGGSLRITPPGLEIMTDFMSDGPLFRGVVAVLSLGAERLAAERSMAHGAALEASAAEALALLNDAMALDSETLDATRKSLASDVDESRYATSETGDFGDNPYSTSRGGLRGGVNEHADVALRRGVAMRAETVDRSLLRDPSACACVLGFCRYRFDPRVPLRAIQILAVLSERNERLLDLLPPNAADALAEGAAGVLELASSAEIADFETRFSKKENLPSDNAFDDDPEDAVAAAGAAVLDVILDALPRRTPNVAHALLGFDASLDPARAVNLSPFGDKFTCLTVLLELLEATPPSACAGDADVAPPEAAARVLFELVADERTAPAALEAVTNWPPGAPGGQQRLALLAADTLAATPPSDPRRRAAAAHHRAWLLRVAAAALDYCAPKTRWPVETLDDLPPLAAALARAATRSDPGFERDGGYDGEFAVEKPRLAALETLATIPPPPLPPLAAANAALEAFGFLSEETRAARTALGVDALLSDRRPVDRGGCFEVTSRGDAVVSVAALGARLLENSKHLRERNANALGSNLTSREAHKLAVQSAVRQARAFNASAEEHAAHAHVAGAWAEFVALVAARCTPQGSATTLADDQEGGGPDGGGDVLFALAEGVLSRLAQTPIPRSSGVSGVFSESYSGDGGGENWWRTMDLPLARLAATLLGELRDGAEARCFLSLSSEEEDTESDYSSRAAAAASRALDAAVGGGSPGAGVVDAAAFAVSPFTRGGGGAWQSLSTPDPSRCKALLRGVLGALRRGEARAAADANGVLPGSVSSSGSSIALDVEARACAYETLLAFLQYARPRRAAGRFPRSVARLAEDGARHSTGDGETNAAEEASGKDDENVHVSVETKNARLAARRAARAQDELEAGVGATLRRDAVKLADVVGRDIVDPAVDDATRAAALAVAEALLTAVAAEGHAPGHAFGAFVCDGEKIPAGAAFAFAEENRATPGVASGARGAEGAGAGSSVPVAPPRAPAGAPPLVADPATSALARALARAGVIRHCLAAVQSANLSDVILPTAAAAARLAATRAALGVLLRLAQLPGGAKALCESGAMAALAACRAVDAYAHDSPGDAAAASAAAAARARAEARRAEGGGNAQRRRLGYDDDFMDGDFSERNSRSLDDVDPAAAASVAAASPLAPPPLARARHHALLVPVLRLAGTLVNASPTNETRLAAISFCRAHAAVLHRVLADRSKHAHLCDVAELEAAVALVARLVSFDDSKALTNENFTSSRESSQTSSLSEFVPALDALTAVVTNGDSKYDRFVAVASDQKTAPLLKTSHGEVCRRVAESNAGTVNAAVGGLSAPVAAAAAAKIEKALRSVRATLVSAQLSLAERGAAVFAKTEQPGEDTNAAPRPTLAAFARLAQRCAEEMREDLKARRVDLRRLARDGGVAAAAAAAADARGAGGAASAEAAAAFAAAGDAEHGATVLGGVGSALGATGDPTALASLAAAAVGARERGVRALAVTAEAALELVLSGGFRGGNHFDGTDSGTFGSRETDQLADVLAPAVRALAELDASESAAEAAFFGGGGVGSFATEQTLFGGGFAGGICADGGRLRALVRRARDALAAAAPPREAAHAPLLAGPGVFFSPSAYPRVESKRFGGGMGHVGREFW